MWWNSRINSRETAIYAVWQRREENEEELLEQCVERYIKPDVEKLFQH